MNIRSLRSSRAFTLIELLIVITIIGILAVALLPRITAGPAKARDAQRKADLQQIATALALYADDNSNAYPWGSSTAAGCVNSTTMVSALTSYMTSVPSNPANVTTTATTGCSLTGSYAYWVTGNGFILVAPLETTSTTGVGIYETASISSTYIPYATTTTTATIMASTGSYLGSTLCSTTDSTTTEICTAGASYVLPR